MTRRAVIYARYSSESQREASIDGQIGICRAFADHHGWELVNVFTDRAISGSTFVRAGYQGLLEAARRGEFDVIVAEAVDRLSRDQEHVAAFYKQMKFAGIDVVTVAEGLINGSTSASRGR